MPIELTPDQEEYLRSILSRKPRPTRRQRATAILLLGHGHEPRSAARIVGIPLSEVRELERVFTVRGVKALDPPARSSSSTGRSRAGIEKIVNVCGGSARIAGTRIPVWQLVAARRIGASGAQLLLDYPGLRADDLVNAWLSARDHQDEIEFDVRETEDA